ncbi:MAG: TRAP transporter substrate-binding protein DctP [Gammaproteobacteria bacterium]|nr:TRAP transporter substrate-binding protein DctP [Gammaproteobacteria bacterium]
MGRRCDSATGLTAMPAMSAEETLNGASCFPIGSPVSKPWEAFVEEVNKRGKGVVQINIVGGAPAIGSPFTLVQRMAAGAYDIVGCTEAYFGNVVPEVPAMRFAERSYAELRKNGGIDYMQKLLGAKNVFFVARHHDFGPFFLFLGNKPISKPDLTGLNLRVSPVYTAFFRSLGATVQTSNIDQVYTYMENGTVQGYGWPALGWLPSWIKVTKYRVEPGFYNSTLHTVANLSKWNSLSPKARGIIQTVGLDFEARSEPDSPELMSALRAQKDKTAKEGMQAIVFTGADAAKWSKAASDAGWAEVLERSPQHGAQLRKLFTK